MNIWLMVYLVILVLLICVATLYVSIFSTTFNWNDYAKLIALSFVWPGYIGWLVYQLVMQNK